MDIPELLEKLGLNAKQASTYLALLELGSAPVSAVSHKSGIKRPTTYLILAELVRRGLASEVPQKDGVVYMAESPQRLMSEAARHYELMQRYLPNLLALHNNKKEKPDIQLFQGNDGVTNAYSKIYETNTEVWFFGTVREIGRLDADSVNKYLKRIRTSGVQIRDLFVDIPDNRKVALATQSLPNYIIKFIPPHITFPVSDGAVFGNTVVFFSFKPLPLAVVITSAEIAGTIRMLYELAWQVAVPAE